MGIWKYLQSSLNSLKLFLGVSRGILRWISMQENAPFHHRKYEIFPNSQFLQEFHRFSLLPLLKLTMTSKCRKSIFWVSENIYWLRLTCWNNFRGTWCILRWISMQENALFHGKKFEIFQIFIFSFNLTDFHGFHFWSLQCLLSLHKISCGCLDVLCWLNKILNK